MEKVREISVVPAGGGWGVCVPNVGWTQSDTIESLPRAICEACVAALNGGE